MGDYLYKDCLNPILATLVNSKKRKNEIYAPGIENSKNSIHIIGNLKNLNKRYGNNFIISLLSQDNVLKLPCRKCINCQYKRSREWSIRNSLEARDFDDKFFLTLTYDNDNIFEVNNNFSLSHNAISSFMKNLRSHKDFKDYKIRFFACGEYGGKLFRPHYHMLLYGLKIPDLDLLYTFQNRRYYKSKIIERIWNKGFVYISDFSDFTAMYVAQYCTKKVDIGFNNFLKDKKIVPEFIQMSSKPTIGLNYFNNHKDEIYNKDGFLFHIDYKTLNCKPFRIYDLHYDLENPRHLDFIKDNRKSFIKEYDYLMHYSEQVHIYEFLQTNERILKNKLKGGRAYYESNKK